MTSISQSPQESFRLLLLTVVGQAFSAAGYTLEERPTQWAGGLFRFAKTLTPSPDSPSLRSGYQQSEPANVVDVGVGGRGLTAFIEYQLLAYTETMWASRNPS